MDDLIDSDLNLIRRPENRTTENRVTEGYRQGGIPTTVIATTHPRVMTTITVNTGAIPRTSTTNQTLENQDNSDETLYRTPAVSTVRPFSIQERNWFRDVYNTFGQMADEEEMDLRMIPQNVSSPIVNN